MLLKNSHLCKSLWTGFVQGKIFTIHSGWRFWGPFRSFLWMCLFWSCTSKFPVREISWFLFSGVYYLPFSLVSVCRTAPSLGLPHSLLVLSGPIILDYSRLHQCSDRWDKHQSVSTLPCPWKIQNIGRVIHSRFAPMIGSFTVSFSLCGITGILDHQQAALLSCSRHPPGGENMPGPVSIQNKWDRNQSFGHSSENLERWTSVPTLWSWRFSEAHSILSPGQVLSRVRIC